MALATPVALFIFKRADLTEMVLQTVALAKPKKLFVIADGARNPAEALQCEEARAVIKKVDWDCEVLTNFAETNMRGPWRISSGISWVFSQVEEAIFLEDDCLPSPSFFGYCAELLERYRDDERIMHISGDNFGQHTNRMNDASYFFSRYSMVWGWASWRRAWRYFDLYMKSWPAFRDGGWMKIVCDTEREQAYWKGVFEACVSKGDVHWDCAWLYACWTQNGYSILPTVNLVSNLGFRNDASHTVSNDGQLAGLRAGEIGPLIHPDFVVRDREADMVMFDKVFGRWATVKPIPRILRGLKRRMKFWR